MNWSIIYCSRKRGRFPAGEGKSGFRGERRVLINQGDIYWVSFDAPGGTEPGIAHPQVVIQENVLNRSRIKTLVVCGLTTNAKRAYLPGNVRLEVGEANLPRQSTVVVSQVSTVDKEQLGEYIGSLTQKRIDQILAGMRFLQLLSGSHGKEEK